MLDVPIQAPVVNRPIPIPAIEEIVINAVPAAEINNEPEVIIVEGNVYKT